MVSLGAAVVMTAALSSCKPQQYCSDSSSTRTLDSVATAYQSVIDSMSGEYERLSAEYASLSSRQQEESVKTESETIIIERYDSTGMLRERERREKITDEYWTLAATVEQYEATTEEQRQTIERLTAELQKTSTRLAEAEAAQEERTEVKKEIPAWCWIVLEVMLLVIVFFIVKLLRKFGIIP